MSREDYLQNLRQEKYGFIVYCYFRERSGIPLSPEDFATLFSDYLSKVAIRFMLDGNSLLDYCEKLAMEYYDNKHGINVILKKEQVVGVY